MCVLCLLSYKAPCSRTSYMLPSGPWRSAHCLHYVLGFLRSYPDSVPILAPLTNKIVKRAVERGLRSMSENMCHTTLCVWEVGVHTSVRTVCRWISWINNLILLLAERNLLSAGNIKCGSLHGGRAFYDTRLGIARSAAHDWWKVLLISAAG